MRLKNRAAYQKTTVLEALVNLFIWLHMLEDYLPSTWYSCAYRTKSGAWLRQAARGRHTLNQVPGTCTDAFLKTAFIAVYNRPPHTNT
ncbi:unnamed protein product [Leptosia nina]|uniref:Uncharacterized protein n=1 Tax=Leptosia nina TaxID=320188 RepID=A0AAV1JX73_9NEOP